MASPLTGSNGGKTEQYSLCVAAGLFLALSLTWVIYPRIYEHYHPTPPWPGEPEGFGFSNAGLSFCFGFFLTLLGFAQLRFRSWFARDTSRILLRTFLFLSLAMAVTYWTFSLAIRFWTITHQQLHSHSLYAYEMSRTVARGLMPTTFAIGLLNVVLAIFHGRNSQSSAR